jgi:hypothetical protein
MYRKDDSRTTPEWQAGFTGLSARGMKDNDCMFGFIVVLFRHVSFLPGEVLCLCLNSGHA